MKKTKKKVQLKPLVEGEVIKLPCGKTIEPTSIAGTIVVVRTNAGFIHDPITSQDYVAVRRTSIKPLIEILRRAEKTFQKG